MCRLVMGNKSTALAEIWQACQLCNQHPNLLQVHRPQLHALIGLYAMSMNAMAAAEAQFLAALRMSTVIKFKGEFFYIRNSIYSRFYHCLFLVFYSQQNESYRRLRI